MLEEIRNQTRICMSNHHLLSSIYLYVMDATSGILSQQAVYPGLGAPMSQLQDRIWSTNRIYVEDRRTHSHGTRTEMIPQ